jgi:hypothetical protein
MPLFNFQYFVATKKSPEAGWLRGWNPTNKSNDYCSAWDGVTVVPNEHVGFVPTVAQA